MSYHIANNVICSGGAHKNCNRHFVKGKWKAKAKMLMAVGAVIVVEVGLIAYTLCKQRRYIKSSERKEDLTQTVGEQAYVVFSDWYRLERMQEEEAYILEVLEQKKARYEYYKEHVPAVYEKLRLAGWVK